MSEASEKDSEKEYMNRNDKSVSTTETDGCPECNTPLIWNLAYGVDECPKCGYYKGNCD